MTETIQEIRVAINAYSMKKVQAAVTKALEEGIDVTKIINDGLIGGMNEIGVKFKANEVFVPEVLVAARAMGAGMKIVKPLIMQAGIKEKGTIVIGTVKNDMHDIGKNLVMLMLEGAGYKVVDLGIDVSAEKFLAAAEEHNPDIVGMAALLTTTMTQMKSTVALLKAHMPNVKIMVGGAPVTPKFATEIGADLYAVDAAVAVELANQVVA